MGWSHCAAYEYDVSKLKVLQFVYIACACLNVQVHRFVNMQGRKHQGGGS